MSRAPLEPAFQRPAARQGRFQGGARGVPHAARRSPRQWPKNPLARVSYISSLTAPRHRLLILQQTTSGFLQARRAGPTPELEKMRAHNATLNQFLADHQIDYDLGDEYMLEWYGRVQGKRFEIAETHYDLLVLPPAMANLLHYTLPPLEHWRKNGGALVAPTPTPPSTGLSAWGCG